jgi:hypothetical protein
VDADDELAALARAAAIPTQASGTGDALWDARRLRDPVAFAACLQSALDGLGKRHAELLLDFADGQAWRQAPGQRWRLFRKPVHGLED